MLSLCIFSNLKKKMTTKQQSATKKICLSMQQKNLLIWCNFILVPVNICTFDYHNKKHSIQGISHVSWQLGAPIKTRGPTHWKNCTTYIFRTRTKFQALLILNAARTIWNRRKQLTKARLHQQLWKKYWKIPSNCTQVVYYLDLL